MEIWADSRDIGHLLEREPYDSDLPKHDADMRIILLTLPNHGRSYVRGSQTLSEVWSNLLRKFMPSTNTEARRLWNKLCALRQNCRTMVEHVNEHMTVKNQLTALGEKQIIGKSEYRTGAILPMSDPGAPPLKLSSVDSPTATASITRRTASSSDTDTAAEEVSSAATREGRVDLQQLEPQPWLR